MNLCGTHQPICKYGKDCYRKNPQHFIDFAHPWLHPSKIPAGTPSPPVAPASATIPAPAVAPVLAPVPAPVSATAPSHTSVPAPAAPVATTAKPVASMNAAAQTVKTEAKPAKSPTKAATGPRGTLALPLLGVASGKLPIADAVAVAGEVRCAFAWQHVLALLFDEYHIMDSRVRSLGRTRLDGPAPRERYGAGEFCAAPRARRRGAPADPGTPQGIRSDSDSTHAKAFSC